MENVAPTIYVHADSSNAQSHSYHKGNFYIGVPDVNGIRQNKATLHSNDAGSGNVYTMAYGRAFNNEEPVYALNGNIF